MGKMSQFFKSISIALQNIRANPLHTFLSTLGIIIGVASLVAILALSDGLEKMGREQIGTTTDIQMMSIRSVQYRQIDGIRVPVEDPAKFSIEKAFEIEDKFAERTIVEMYISRAATAVNKDSTSSLYLDAHMDKSKEFMEDSLQKGRFISREDLLQNRRVAVITKKLADKLGIQNLNEIFVVEGKEIKVVGILSDEEAAPKAFIPINTYWTTSGSQFYPQLIIKATNIEDIALIEEELNDWFDKEFEQGREGFQISTNKMRVEQFSEGILIFKLVMGAITGISVLVGGIGIMNVLLISVTERTKEIGIRKATGAKKKDIILQFMAESITVSLAGCILGWIVGIAGVFAFIPIVNSLADVRFTAAITFGTVFSILVIALIVGVVFGTYPAWRAAQLTPVDAIRHE